MQTRVRFGPPLTPMVKRIMIINAAIWVLQIICLRTGVPFTEYLWVFPEQVLQGMAWQLFTYMWLHDPGGLLHIAFNMFTLWMFGGQIEQVWGSRRFLNFYLTCGFGAGVIIFLWNWLTGLNAPTFGASGAVYACLTAFSLLWPDRTVMLLFPPIPMRAIWFIPFLFGLQLLFSGGQNISHVGHLGGVLVAGYLLKEQVAQILNFRSLRYAWHRQRMKGRLRAVRREEWEQRRRHDDDDDRPTYH